MHYEMGQSMKKYVYENATVYITIPTEAQIQNIHKATERFVRTLAKKGLIGNEQRSSNSRASRAGSDARKRTR